MCVVDVRTPKRSVRWLNPFRWASFRQDASAFKYCAIGCIRVTPDAFEAVPMPRALQLAASAPFDRFHLRLVNTPGLTLPTEGLIWKTFPMYSTSAAGHDVPVAFATRHPNALYVQMWTHKTELPLLMPDGSERRYLAAHTDAGVREVESAAVTALNAGRKVVVVISEPQQVQKVAKFSYHVAKQLDTFDDRMRDGYMALFATMQVDVHRATTS